MKINNNKIIKDVYSNKTNKTNQISTQFKNIKKLSKTRYLKQTIFLSFKVKSVFFIKD